MLAACWHDAEKEVCVEPTAAVPSESIAAREIWRRIYTFYGDPDVRPAWSFSSQAPKAVGCLSLDAAQRPQAHPAYHCSCAGDVSVSGLAGGRGSVDHLTNVVVPTATPINRVSSGSDRVASLRPPTITPRAFRYR